jgi:hypothetical protein
MQQLSAADPSNTHYREEALYRRVMLATLLGNTGQLELARSLMRELESEFESSGELTEQAFASQKEYLEFLLASADVEFQLRNVESTNKLLQEAIQLQLTSSFSKAGGIFDTQWLVKTRYQWWQLNGKDNIDRFPVMPDFGQTSTIEIRSCTDAESAARMYVIADEKASAAREVSYLQARGYADPNFIRFCEQHGLCVH